MRELVENLRSGLTEFTSQRDDLFQIVQCSEPDAGLVLKILEGLNEASASDPYWFVIDAFENTDDFVDKCVASVSPMINAIRLTQEKNGSEPICSLPKNMLNKEKFRAIDRLRNLMEYTRSLLPQLDGCCVVWCLLPLNITNRLEYANFVNALTAHEFPFPWCHHIRMVIRDEFEKPIIDQIQFPIPRSRTLTADFSPPAIEKSLQESVQNEQLPLQERVNNALLLAGIDFSHGRYERAIQQYALVEKYAASTKNPIFALIALNGLGETYRALGDLEKAGDFFQAAMGPAAQVDPPPVPVLFNLYFNLADLRYTQERWDEAEPFFLGAADFAMLLRDAGQRLRCWDYAALAQLQQDKIKDAIETWSNAAIVSAKLENKEDYDKYLVKLKVVFEEKVSLSEFQKQKELINEKIAQKEEGKPKTPAKERV
ncbi:MAG: tetratricopeptide repeat protein [Gammaproteobacteria bacterium]|nr:tetratricopeptide repeat protein [Gammaproteobacteria bacterium]MDH5692824.1 tetratricopeptide repeat protein [Gammaproteobacteria bacterium]